MAVVAIIIFVRSSFVVGPAHRRCTALVLLWGHHCARWLFCCSWVGTCSLCRGVLRWGRRLHRFPPPPPHHIRLLCHRVSPCSAVAFRPALLSRFTLLRRRVSPCSAIAFPPPSSPHFSLLHLLGTLFSSSSFPARFLFRLRRVSTVAVVMSLLLGMVS